MADEVRMSPWTPFPHHGWDAVRIWQRKTRFGMYQAHQWRRPDGTMIMEPWIPGTRGWHPRAVAAPDPDPDPLREALQMIADGHNDPRAVAREALRRDG